MKILTYKIASFFVILLTLSSCAKDLEVMTGVIVGKVTDTKGELLSSVTVTLSPTGLSRTTGNDGVFEMVDLEPMQYTLQATKTGYQTNTKTVSVIAGQTISGDMVLTPEIKSTKISIQPSSLNFGTSLNQMSVAISNDGNIATVWSLDLGNNNWLSATPMTGNIGVGKTQNIVFTIDRDKFTEAQNAVITLTADGNSLPITISCSPDKVQKAEMKIEPTTLDFGDNLNTKEFTIKNVGDGELNWLIKGVDENIITVSETSGTVTSGGSKIVKVHLVREKMTANINTSFIISDGEKEQSITVTATKEGSSSENDNQKGEESSFSGTVTSCRNNLAVELTSVSKSNGIVTVNFTIQNNENFDIYQFSFATKWGEYMAYDNLGNSYDDTRVQEIKLGSKVDAGKSFDVRIGIPKGTKVSCSLTIKDVSDEATEITTISLPCLYYNQAETVTYNQKKIEFKNLKWK